MADPPHDASSVAAPISCGGFIWPLCVQLAASALPWRLRSSVLRYLLGWEIGVGASVGLSLIFAAEVKISEGARIGHFNLLRALMRLHLGPKSSIGQLNWISGIGTDRNRALSHKPDRKPCLYLGEHAAITSRHIIDCTDCVEVGRYTTIAGYRSQILTHGIDLLASRQDCEPAKIGEYCLVGTGATLLMGATVPNCCVIAAGAVVSKSLSSDFTLYAGVPARAVKRLSRESLYMRRKFGPVRIKSQ